MPPSPPLPPSSPVTVLVVDDEPAIRRFLRASLEAQGITVDKLHVQQAPPDQPGGDRNQPGGGGDRQSPVAEQQQEEARRDQQRRDAVQRLWDKLNGIEPLDLVA